MSSKLRDLIRQVRACKTAQDERGVITKECALIRTAFKENNVAYRHRNVAKLLFIHMLGYPSHFGQMECLKLIASPNFPEKRIGYLALMLLLDTKSEVLTLVTNSIKNDLSHPNQFVVGLALASVGNLGNGDMGRILIPDVEKCMRGSNPYLKKKAALVMIRIFKRVPEMIEEYADKMVILLKERAHGVLIAGVQLMITILELEPSQSTSFARLVPSLVRLLRNLLSMGYSPEHDVAGITDPFLQVKLLRLLQLLGVGSDEASDAMNDILAQVATNTETAKNAGNAILYECVKAIMSIEAEAGLRVLAVNILGRFLLNRDNNIRYVALNTLGKVVAKDMDTVQRHRVTIVDCLKDPDVSIRQRALELIYQLTNEKNVVDLMREMLNYLVVATTEQKPALCSKIMDTVDKYSPSRKWRVDTLVTMLSISGNACDASIVSNTIMYVTASEDLHAYATHKLFALLSEELSQRALIQVGVWCIGEYGNYLLENLPSGPEDPESPGYYAVTATAVCDLLDKVKKSHMADTSTKYLVLTAFAKMSQRLDGAEKARVMAHLDQYKESMNMELQQRSVEYTALLSGQWDSLSPMALGRMPAMDEEKLKAKRAREGMGEESDTEMPSSSGAAFAAPSPGPVPKAPSAAAAAAGISSAPSTSSGGGPTNLLDLDDIFGGGSPAPVGGSDFGMGGGGASAPPPSSVDLLADIFSTPASPPMHQNTQVPPHAPSSSGGGGVLDLFATGPSLTPMAPAPASNPTINAYEKNGLKLMMEMSKPDPSDPSKSDILCTFTNTSPAELSSFVFQAAVPKFVQLAMKPPSSSVLPAGGKATLTQVISVKNTQLGIVSSPSFFIFKFYSPLQTSSRLRLPYKKFTWFLHFHFESDRLFPYSRTQKTLMFKMKIMYTANGQSIVEQAQVNTFPPGY
jgi:AP-1 complex subunit gamma-1